LGRLHPECEFIFQLKKDQQRCLKEIAENGNHTTEGLSCSQPRAAALEDDAAPGSFQASPQAPGQSTGVAGCEQTWDAVVCWPLATVGETVNVTCPPVFSYLMKNPGTVSRNCTINGWSNPFPPYYLACTIEDEIPVERESYFATVKVIYTVGYGASIFSLTTAMIILLMFRSLHCARNYVHIQLFASFILRAVAVFIKDASLFASDETEHCTFSTGGCKAAVVLCHYCVMTNFFWLLVEALYLNSLLFSFFHRGRKYFRWFVLLGWGVPTICIIAWIISRMYFEDTECWDVNEISSFWWIIKGPIVVSIGVNFILFINIIRILIQKLDPQLIQFNNSSQYR
ncbi:GHRHR protein, partial [Polyodon spathula]|nr:GHRHR protein [Polyodon spathula]